MKPSNILFAAALSLGACAAAPAPGSSSAAPLTPAVRIPEPVVSELLASTTLAPDAGIAARRHPAGKVWAGPATRVAVRDRLALRETGSEDLSAGEPIYAWAPGASYRLVTGPGRVSDIALEPGEALVSVAAGDTARWVIGDTTSGSGTTQRTHVLVKPASAGLATNLVIATDRRVYHVEAESNSRVAMAGISWTYPSDSMVVLKGQAGTPLVASSAAASMFDYAIEGDRPPWRPIRAFDDGRQVFIEFPASIAVSEAPPLLVSTSDGGSALVNYRVRGHYYIVDRLFTSAELRLGEGRQQVVRIVRRQAGGRIRSRKPA